MTVEGLPFVSIRLPCNVALCLTVAGEQHHFSATVRHSDTKPHCKEVLWKQMEDLLNKTTTALCFTVAGEQHHLPGSAHGDGVQLHKRLEGLPDDAKPSGRRRLHFLAGNSALCCNDTGLSTPFCM